MLLQELWQNFLNNMSIMNLTFWILWLMCAVIILWSTYSAKHKEGTYFNISDIKNAQHNALWWSTAIFYMRSLMSITWKVISFSIKQFLLILCMELNWGLYVFVILKRLRSYFFKYIFLKACSHFPKYFLFVL